MATTTKIQGNGRNTTSAQNGKKTTTTKNQGNGRNEKMNGTNARGRVTGHFYGAKLHLQQVCRHVHPLQLRQHSLYNGLRLRRFLVEKNNMVTKMAIYIYIKAGKWKKRKIERHKCKPFFWCKIALATDLPARTSFAGLRPSMNSSGEK